VLGTVAVTWLWSTHCTFVESTPLKLTVSEADGPLKTLPFAAVRVIVCPLAPYAGWIEKSVDDGTPGAAEATVAVPTISSGATQAAATTRSDEDMTPPRR
jgi:hypothetical protein